MAPRKLKPSDRYSVQRGVEHFQEMMADSASTWLQKAQNAPAQRAEDSHPNPSTTTGAVIPVGSSLVPERATYTFHNYNAAPDGSGPTSAAYSTSSVPMPGAVTAQYGNSLYPGTHGGRSQYNATFPPLPPPPSAAFLPSDPSAIPPLWHPASSPAPPTSALPSPTTSRRSQSAVPHPAAAQSSREPSWSARFADNGQAYEHGLERFANGTSSVRIVEVVPGVYYVVDTGSLPVDAVTYPGAPGPGFFIPDPRAQQQGPPIGDLGPWVPPGAHGYPPLYAHSAHDPSPASAIPPWDRPGSFDMTPISGAQGIHGPNLQQHPVAAGSGQGYPTGVSPFAQTPPVQAQVPPAQGPHPRTTRTQRKRGAPRSVAEDVGAGPSWKTVKKQASAGPSAKGGPGGQAYSRPWAGGGPDFPGCGVFDLNELSPL